jgi:pyruvate formate lyase activating enzyme
MLPGKTGRCGVRGNSAGRPWLPRYGYISALAVDPIEKKPLYHFRPGSDILSVGFAGCNLHCPFCQNWAISQDTAVSAAGRFLSAGALVASAARAGQIAYTYSEPLIHVEYLLDCMRAARREGLANVLVTNGCVEAEAALDVLALTDAVNVDLKCFSEKTYAEVLGGSLGRVKDFIAAACRLGVHVEVTTLVVPGLNDSESELAAAADFLAALPEGASFRKARPQGALEAVPWHLSAYHPDYRWEAPPTDPAMLRAAAERARKTLRYVYTGNTGPDGGFNDTPCPHCGAALVKRRGYRTDTAGMAREGSAWRCRRCGGEAPFRG